MARHPRDRGSSADPFTEVDLATDTRSGLLGTSGGGPGHRRRADVMRELRAGASPHTWKGRGRSSRAQLVGGGIVVVLAGVGLIIVGGSLFGLMLVVVGAIVAAIGLLRLLGAGALWLLGRRREPDPWGDVNLLVPPPETRERTDARGVAGAARRHARGIALLAAGGAGVVLAAVVGWNVLAADRGEILYLSPEPLPEQSGRIARYSIVHIDDPAALRDRVDDRTGAIILPPDRLDELGREWLADQYREGIVIMGLGDISAGELAQRLGVSTGREGGIGSNPAWAYVARACDGSSATAGTNGGPFSFELFRNNMVRILEQDLRC